MPVWSITDTKQHIFRIYGKEQIELVKHSLQSICLRGEYAHYYYHEANKLLDNYLQKEFKTKEPIEVVFENSDSKENILIQIEANVLACLSNIHAVANTFSYAIYYILGLNLKDNSLNEEKINITSVLNLIRLNKEFDKLDKLLTSLKVDGNFKHLTAIVNNTKHRELKRLELFFDLTAELDKSYSIKIPAYRGYPKVEMKDFLTTEYNRIFKLHIDIGNAINEILSKRQI